MMLPGRIQLNLLSAPEEACPEEASHHAEPMPSPTMPPPRTSGPGSFHQSAVIEARIICAVGRFTGRWRGQTTVRLCRVPEMGVVAWATDGHSIALAWDSTGILEADVEFTPGKGDLEKLRPLSQANQERRFVLNESGGAFAETLKFPAKGMPNTSRVALAAEVPQESWDPRAVECLAMAVKIAADRAAGRTPDLALRSFGCNTQLLGRALEAFELMQRGAEGDGVPVQIEAAGSGPVVLTAPGVPLFVVMMPLRREAPLPAPEWVAAFAASRTQADPPGPPGGPAPGAQVVYELPATLRPNDFQAI